MSSVYTQVLNAYTWVSKAGASIGVHEGLERVRAVSRLEGGGVEGECNSLESETIGEG